MVWFPLTVVFGLVNCNAERQAQSDGVLKKMGFEKLPLYFSTIYSSYNLKIVSLFAKLVDSILITGIPAILDDVIMKFTFRLNLVSVSHIPQSMRYFVLNGTQDEDFNTA